MLSTEKMGLSTEKMGLPSKTIARCSARMPRWGASVLGLCALVEPLPAFAVGEKAHAEMKSRDGKDLGKIRIIETTAGVLIRVKLKGLAAGVHGFHIMAVGKCEGDFESAGAIYNPLGAEHGFLNDRGPMGGDLPNLVVPASGEVEMDLVSAFVTLNKESEDSLLDNDGAAFIIHEKPDDYKSDPIGNSGPRIACGVITPTVK
jgi:superoxide dismutase, Cu-Zn family